MSAFNAMRVLRNEIEARLNQNEDYRAFKALENALARNVTGLPKRRRLNSALSPGQLLRR
jgi:hypothetical protein